MPEIDFTGLGLQETIATLLFFAAVDTIAAYAVAVMNKNFNAAYALDFLRTHVLKIGAPIALLAVIGHGVPQAGIPPIPVAAIAATGSLLVYALATIASVKDTFGDHAVSPTPSTSVAPVTETPNP